MIWQKHDFVLEKRFYKIVIKKFICEEIAVQGRIYWGAGGANLTPTVFFST